MKNPIEEVIETKSGRKGIITRSKEKASKFVGDTLFHRDTAKLITDKWKMKKLTSILLAPIIFSACAVQKNLPPQEPQIIKNTVYVEKSISTDSATP